MFVWMDLTVSGVKDSKALIETKALAAKVLFVPGQVFLPDGGDAGPSPFVRAAYSTSTPEQIDEALSRFRQLLLDAKAGQ
jgi:DNA-binding transcriptional MocR family regulator